MTGPVHIFWDNSNIFIPMRDVAVGRDGALDSRHVRAQFDHLYELARAGRPVTKAVCVGSVPPGLEAVWDRIRRLGVNVELYERGQGSGREQGVDQCLQVHMLRAGYGAPGTAVLLTGDGAGYMDGVGFHADLERLADRGWAVEVLSWEIACNRYLRAFAEQRGVFVALEDFYDMITFVQGGRHSRPLSLVRRRTATPTASPS
jgi:hypothetical protein